MVAVAVVVVAFAVIGGAGAGVPLTGPRTLRFMSPARAT